jgi:hypothetical protein
LLLERQAALVIPTLIEGTHEAMPLGRRLPRPNKIRVTFGEPLEVETLRESGEEPESHERISSALHRAVASLKG